jgi:hypothetical protein
MVFSTKPNKTFLINVFFDGKTTRGRIMYVILYSQTNSTIPINNSPLTTNNIRSSTKLTCVASFFLNLEAIEKNQIL